MTSPATSTIIDLQESEEPLLRARRTASPPQQQQWPPPPRNQPPSPSGVTFDSPTGLLDSPVAAPPQKPIVIPPPVLRPQHVYAPVAPMGMLTLGLLSKKKDDGGAGEAGEFKLAHGKNRCSFQMCRILS